MTRKHRGRRPTVQILRKTNHQPVREHSYLSRMSQDKATQLIRLPRTTGVAHSMVSTDSLNLIGLSRVSRSNIVLEMTEQ